MSENRFGRENRRAHDQTGGAPDQARDALSDLLAAAAAPAHPRELAGEEDAVAAFRTARLGYQEQPRRRAMVFPMKVAAAAVGVMATAGIAVAVASSSGQPAPGTGTSTIPTTTSPATNPTTSPVTGFPLSPTDASTGPEAPPRNGGTGPLGPPPGPGQAGPPGGIDENPKDGKPKDNVNNGNVNNGRGGEGDGRPPKPPEKPSAHVKKPIPGEPPPSARPGR